MNEKIDKELKKSIETARKNKVPEDKILHNKKEIDNYFSGGRKVDDKKLNIKRGKSIKSAYKRKDGKVLIMKSKGAKEAVEKGAKKGLKKGLLKKAGIAGGVALGVGAITGALSKDDDLKKKQTEEEKRLRKGC